MDKYNENYQKFYNMNHINHHPHNPVKKCDKCNLQYQGPYCVNCNLENNHSHQEYPDKNHSHQGYPDNCPPHVLNNHSHQGYPDNCPPHVLNNHSGHSRQYNDHHHSSNCNYSYNPYEPVKHIPGPQGPMGHPGKSSTIKDIKIDANNYIIVSVEDTCGVTQQFRAGPIDIGEISSHFTFTNNIDSSITITTPNSTFKTPPLKGANGMDGISVQSAEIVGGHLKLILSNSNVIDVGNIVGPQGPTGEIGPVGPQGPQGTKGDSSQTINFSTRYLSEKWLDAVNLENSENSQVYSRGWLYPGLMGSSIWSKDSYNTGFPGLIESEVGYIPITHNIRIKKIIWKTDPNFNFKIKIHKLDPKNTDPTIVAPEYQTVLMVNVDAATGYRIFSDADAVKFDEGDYIALEIYEISNKTTDINKSVINYDESIPCILSIYLENDVVNPFKLS